MPYLMFEDRNSSSQLKLALEKIEFHACEVIDGALHKLGQARLALLCLI